MKKLICCVTRCRDLIYQVAKRFGLCGVLSHVPPRELAQAAQLSFLNGF